MALKARNSRLKFYFSLRHENNQVLKKSELKIAIHNISHISKATKHGHFSRPLVSVLDTCRTRSRVGHTQTRVRHDWEVSNIFTKKKLNFGHDEVEITIFF